jgi:hypothetical protein
LNVRRILLAIVTMSFFVTGFLPGIGGAASAAPLDTSYINTDHSKYVTHPYYTGTRFKTTKICVQLKTSRTWLRDRVKEAVADWNDHTNLVMFVRTDCSSYGQRLYVKAAYYGKYDKCGGYTYYSCYSPGKRVWGKTSKGHSTYLITRATIKLNLSNFMSLSTAYRDSAITHEFGHVGLSHIPKCGDTVMRSDWKCFRRESGSIDRKAMNSIYSQ